ncbi:hypothetical protein [Actinomadura flavalba]|uniref:hypothetical protein n=1 Tax=Actinomadura flavalba TaxID=1120938 RepID=UPI00035F2CE4|nr:hypothetical protein [Actinomadura flavalba]
MTDERGDVPSLSDVQLQVYEAVATIDASGGAADIETLTHRLALPEEDLWAALSHLVDADHVHSTPDGYVLGPHDRSA